MATYVKPRRAPEPSRRPLLAVGLLGLGAAAGAAWLLKRTLARPGEAPAEGAARALDAGAAVLALSVALDSALEHYKGSFENKAMFVAPAVATATLAVATRAAFRPGRDQRYATLVYGTALAAGAAGSCFHVYNIAKRVGRFDLDNLFYAAPLGAPSAIALAGLFGLLGRRFAAGKADHAALVAPLTAAALIGTVAEAGFLHFRGAFQDPMMYAPVTVPPLAAAALAATPVLPAVAPVTKQLLEATAVLGIAGPIFHSYGIHRNMGGWRNWSQMILQGPPIPAPPAFTGIALVGLGLLPLLEDKRR